MPLRANISPSYVWRVALVGVVCLGIAGWFLFDGVVTYPRQRTRALEYQQLEEEDRLDEWEDLARQHGWSTADPGKPKSEAEILTQLILGGLVMPPALLFLIRFLMIRKRWVEADETGLRSSSGRQLQFDQIVSLNKKQWSKKGIAVVVYQQGKRKRRFVLDDWKYEPDPTVAILREVEARIDREQIVGGAPEPPPKEKTEDKPAAE